MSFNTKICNLILALAFCFWFISLQAQNSVAVDSLLNALSVAKDSKVKIEVLLAVSAQLEGSDHNKALNYAQQAYLFSRQSGNRKGEINSLIQKGNCYFRMSDYRHAMECAETSMALAEEFKMDKEIALSLNVIGWIYNELGEYENSSEQFYKSLSIFEKTHDNKGISQSLGFLGTVYDNQNDRRKALEYLNRSLTIAKQRGDWPLITKNLNNISIVYLHLKKYDTALIYINEALRISKQLNDKRSIGINYINIGLIQIRQQKYDEALSSLQKVLELHKEFNNRVLLTNYYLSLARCYAATGNKEACIDAYKSALSEAQQAGYINIIYDASGELGKLFLEKRDTSNAFKYKIIENLSKDSLSQIRIKKNLINLEFQYQTEKKEFEKKITQQKKETLMLIVILGLIAGLIITILFLSRNRIKARNVVLVNQALEKELSFKNKELSINLMAIMKKNEMLADISTRLIQIEKEAINDETKDSITKISHELRKGADEKLWKEFSARFQEVHHGFYEALLEKFPDLTQNELKLCAFLRLNMSTKDISELTGQSKLTLENARYRLRKKLGITNSESNLVTFLLHI
ncbi:MAG: tetratricopeptide repeat protein [Bacteroidales bacterium]